MREPTSAETRHRKITSWYLAETLPGRIPRCTDCGQPALSAADRVTGRAAGSIGFTVTFRHHDCATAPRETLLRLTADATIGSVVEYEGIAHRVTSIVFVAGTNTVPAHWRILGVPNGVT